MPPPCFRDSSFAFVPLTQLSKRPLTWLWPGWLPRGKLTILDGDPGVGKSLVTLSLCASVTAGQPFPDGTAGPEPGNAVVLNGEDDFEDTIRPRLERLGGDPDRVFTPKRQGLEAEAGDLLRLPTDLAALDGALAETQSKLVVIDPLAAFLDRSILSASDQSVRQLLYPLAVLAGKHECAVLLVRHLNKTGKSRALYRGGGSIGFVGACRGVWLIARDPEDPERCVLAQVKNNLATVQPSLAYTMVTSEGEPPRLAWQGATDRTPDQLLGARAVGSPLAVRRQEAADALEAFLLEGVRTSHDVWAFAEAEGISERTLRRAKEDLQVRSKRVWAEGKRLSYWLLPGQQLPANLAGDADEYDLEPWLAPLREKYPSPTPIDDL